MKKEQKQEWDANSLCIPYISLHPSLHALCMTREDRGMIIRNTQSVSIPFLFLFFFHQSSLYPIKKCFYVLVHIGMGEYYIHDASSSNDEHVLY